ncbi:MAG: DUF1631 family protein [Agarilytica sp.]
MPEHAKQDTEAKVVHLEPESQRIVRAKLARLPAAVHSVHEKGRFLVLNLLKTFFDRADDSLFELADKAQSNQEQNLYFDSMREVRVQRRGIEKRFGDAIDLAFAELISADTSQADSARSFSPDTLSLVENDELDEIVAVDTSIARANQEYGEEIQLISLRLDSLVPLKVYQKNNPLGPDVLCATFMEEAKKLDVGIKAKLVLFKLFDKAVVSKLADVYLPINELFREHNVLPSLCSQGTQRSRRRGDVVPEPSLSAGPAAQPLQDAALGDDSNVSPEVLSTLKNMLGERVLSNPTAPSQTQAAAGELMQLLSRIQHMPALMDNRVAINVRSLLNQLQQQNGVQAKIGQVDDQVMNLVNMLFDFILEDRNLAAPMKALISRMQIPIIKVAVADKSFFTKGGHVARRLLNEMATAAIGWTGDQENCANDPLFKKIESIVRTLIEQFETDLSIFSELLTDFTAFLEKEKKRAAVMERRTIDAEDGKAKAEVARTTVELEVELRTTGVALPQVVTGLIKDAWSNVLFVTALKYGYDSDEWHTQLSVLEDLVGSVQPPQSLDQRQKLIKLVPGLVKQLRSGLDTISYNPFEMSDLFKSLEKVHIACIRGRAKAKTTEQKAPAAKAPQPQRNSAPQGEKVAAAPKLEPRKESPIAQSSKRPVPRKPDQAAPEELGEFPARSLHDLAKGVELSEIETVDRLLSQSQKASSESVAPEQARSTPLPKDDPFMIQVGNFSQGTWFDMEDGSGENVRCRLAALIKPTGKYIFVNRAGMKVAEHSQEELAYMLKSSTLNSLDNSMLFDRALETVVTGLRKA